MIQTRDVSGNVICVALCRYQNNHFEHTNHTSIREKFILVIAVRSLINEHHLVLTSSAFIIKSKIICAICKIINFFNIRFNDKKFVPDAARLTSRGRIFKITGNHSIWRKICLAVISQPNFKSYLCSIDKKYSRNLWKAFCNSKASD